MIFFWGITLNLEYLVLDMKEMKEEDIIKKALAGGLTDKEKEFLAGREPVLRHLKEQWNEPGDSFLSPVAKERVLGRVMRKIHPYNTRRDYWMKYAVAASLALLISVGSWLIGQSGTKEKTIYVVSAGRQSMESFYLPDGSHVSLNAGGRLTYPESFDGERREVSLSGQAFFEVHHDPEHPFIVKTKSMDIKVNLEAKIANELSVDAYEFASVIANLFENALLCVNELEEGEKYVNADIQCTGRHLLVDFKNKYEGEIEFDATTGLPKSKKGKNHGFGMQSVLAFSEKIGGNIGCYCEDGIFHIMMFAKF